jgi:hypothetical protein
MEDTMRRIKVLTGALSTLLMASFAIADVPLVINYQGRLTDDTGEPLSGIYYMVFTIYNSETNGESKWSEPQPDVTVDNGIFSVLLGSIVPLDDSVFTGGDRYLGIKIGADPEISPRTRLTSVPSAVTAKSVKGDIETGESSLVIKNNSGDSSIVIDAGSDKGSPRMSFSIPIDPHYPSLEFAASTVENSMKVGFAAPPDPYEPAVELSSSEIGSMVQINWGWPPDPCREAIVLNADNNGNTFKINSSWPPDPMQPVFEIFSDAVNEEVNMRLGAPPDPMIPEFEVIANSLSASLRLGQPPDPMAPGIELIGSIESGPSMNLYDEIGQIMGVEPMPFNEGIVIKLTDPVNGGNLLEISSNHYSGNAGIKMATPVPEPPRTLLEMTTDPTNGPNIYLATPVPEPPRAVELSVEQTAGPRSEWGGYFNMYSMDPGDAGAKSLEISNTTSAGAHLKLFNAQPGKASTTAVNMYYDSLVGGGTVICYSDDENSTAVLTGRELSFSNGASTTVYIYKEGGAAFSQHIGIGVWPISNILHIQQDSPTDPIADAWTVYSSKRWKKNIEPIEGALEKVEQLRGVSFEWESNDKHDIGMIAEEVGEVVPEVVTYEENGQDAQSIDYGRLTAILVEAVKELKAENEDLRSRIEKLEIQ